MMKKPAGTRSNVESHSVSEAEKAIRHTPNPAVKSRFFRAQGAQARWEALQKINTGVGTAQRNRQSGLMRA